jgi:transposase-like protein
MGSAVIDSYNAAHGTDINLHQHKYLTNIVKQDHRAMKRIVRPMLGFDLFNNAYLIADAQQV